MGGGAGSSGSISASFLGLKAELERSKSQQASSSSCKRKSASTLEDDKKPSKKLSSTFLTSTSTSTRASTSKPRYFQTQDGDKSSRKQKRDNVASSDDGLGTSSAQLDAIKSNLERKARIYQQLQAGKFAGISRQALQEGSIDWERKLADPHQAPSRSPSPESARGKRDEEMVEYQDEFGRTRTAPLSQVPRQFLPTRYGGDLQQEEEEGDEDNAIYGPATSFPVYDPSVYRRNEGEKRLEQEHFKPAWENRYRGAAYYRFSEDEAKRKEQIKQLAELREQTIANRRQGRQKQAQ